MRHLFSPIFHGLCLLAAVATSGLWARSYFVADQYIWPVRSGGGGFEMIDSRSVMTTPGRLVFQERTALM
jgi:hypothetical protein